MFADDWLEKSAFGMSMRARPLFRDKISTINTFTYFQTSTASPSAEALHQTHAEAIVALKAFVAQQRKIQGAGGSDEVRIVWIIE